MLLRLVLPAILLLPGSVLAFQCGRPQFAATDPAAIYIWQECADHSWKARALGGGSYANFQGTFYTDGEFSTVAGVGLGPADSLVHDSRSIRFNFRIWDANFDGVDFRTVNDSRVYFDLANGIGQSVFIGRDKDRPAQLPVKLGGDGQRYNVVVILTDDQRFDTLWAMPIVDRELVQKGINFTGAIVTSPLCCPFRAGLLSGGLYDKNTGVYSNKPPSGSFALFQDQENLGTVLQQAGYRTGLVGKVMNDYPAGYVMPGWDYLVANPGPGRESWYAFTATVGSSGTSPTTGQVVGPITQYVTDYQRDRALEFIRASAAQPFFLLIGTYAPHGPATAPAEDLAPFAGYHYSGRGFGETDLLDKPRWVWDPTMALGAKVPMPDFPAQQLASLQAVDRLVGAVVDELQAQGLMDSTVIVFTSDNGFMWGEHGIWQKPYEFDESLRVPLVVRFPGAQPRGDHRQVAANLDVATLVLDIANSQFHTDGQSLMPLMLDDHGSWREWLPISLYNHETTLSWAGIRSESWKYSENVRGDRMLFNLVADPFELENLAASPNYAAVASQLKARLDAEKGLMITSLQIPKPTLGYPYATQLRGWGGTPPYSWSVVAQPVAIHLGLQSWLLQDVDLPLSLSDDANLCGTPQMAADNLSRFYIWRDCNGGNWHVRATGGYDYGQFSGQVLGIDPIISASPFGLGPADAFNYMSPDRIDFLFRIWGNNQNGIDFGVGGSRHFQLSVSGAPGSLIQYGSTGLDISRNTWPKVFGDPLACGQPQYDPTRDRGVFIWRTCADRVWHLFVLAGGDEEKIDGVIRADGPVTILQTYDIGSNDTIKADPGLVTFSIDVWGQFTNGFDFSIPNGVTASIDFDTHQLPHGLTLDANTGLLHGTVSKPARRDVWIRAQDHSVRKVDGGPQAFTADYAFDVH